MDSRHYGCYVLQSFAWKITVSLTIFSWLLSLTTCQAYQGTETPPSRPISSMTLRKAIPFQSIAQQAPLGDRPTEPFFGLFWQPGDLEGLVSKLPQPALEAARQAGAPGELILIAFAGVKGSSGYQIAIQRIWQEGNQIIIQVVQTKPNVGQAVEPARTLPFFLAKLTRADLPQETTLEFIFKDDKGEVLKQQTVALPK